MCKQFFLAALLVLSSFHFTLNGAATDETVILTISALVPAGTPADARICLAGNLSEVGSWKADGVPMTRAGDAEWRVQLTLPRGAALEYKITRGTWQTVEKDAKGQEIENRRVVLDHDQVVKISVLSWANGQPSTQSTSTGDIRVHAAFASRVLGNQRRICVWLPPDYQKNPAVRYPVLYLHDGQNCFDAATSFAGEWRADETAAELIRAGRIEPIIMVAVDNAGAARMNEYTPTRDAQMGAGGDGEKYARFLIEEVKPLIDRTYRTIPDRDHTAVAGSSLGGLISLYLIKQHGDVFGRCAAISPTLNWDDRQLLHAMENDGAWSRSRPIRIWMDIGTAEGTPEDAARGVEACRAMAEVFQAHGLKPKSEFDYREFTGAPHNESAWSSRFDQVLIYLFGR
jgi:predicted alpha/beta superfamily hydrolase